MLKEHTQETIGKLLTDEAYRDAIHIAVLPVVCGDESITPGASIKLLHGTKHLVGLAVEEEHYTGIADPFLKCPIRRGERFWMFLKPNTVTGMRHEWSHPDIETEQVPKSESEKWLKTFASSWNMDYSELISEASGSGTDRYIVASDINLHSGGELGEDEHLFWKHLENLTGRSFDTTHRENFSWSCSC